MLSIDSQFDSTPIEDCSSISSKIPFSQSSVILSLNPDAKILINVIYCLPNPNNLKRIVLFSSKILASEHLVWVSKYLPRFLLKIDSKEQIIELKVCESALIDYKTFRSLTQGNNRKLITNNKIYDAYNYHELYNEVPAAILIMLELEEYVLNIEIIKFFIDKIFSFTENLQKFSITKFDFDQVFEAVKALMVYSNPEFNSSQLDTLSWEKLFKFFQQSWK